MPAASAATNQRQTLEETSMSTSITRRGTIALAAATALMLAAFAAPQADASTLYACVKKNGTARFVSKTVKCKKGEKRLSWNTEGPAGKNGANGTNGTNGTNGKDGAPGLNGAVAGYSVSQSGFINITAEQRLIVSKTLPAGHYLVSAKVETSAAGKSIGLIETQCELFDGSPLDESQWIGVTSEFIPGTFLASSTLPMQTVLDVTKPTAVQVWCETQLNKVTSGEVTASQGQLFAVQTGSNS
jgi:hypothetical protein